MYIIRIVFRRADNGELLGQILLLLSAMSENLELTKFCKQVEALFSNYHVTYCWGWNGVMTSVEIRANNDIFTTAFLRFLCDRLKSHLFFFKCDLTGQPIVKIIV